VCGFHPLAVRLHRLLDARRRSAHASLPAFYRSLIRRDDLVFDIGANTGAYADVFDSLGATVIAVEPNSDCVRHIEITYRGRRIEPILAAVASRNGLVQINISDRFDDMSTLSGDWVACDRERRGSDAVKIWNRRVTVPCITLDCLIATFGMPAYIKIDIEGAESDVLDGLSAQPPLLSFEFHSFDFAGALRCLRKAVLQPSASSFNITDSTGSSFALSSWTDCSSMERILADLSTKETYRDIYVRAPSAS
jgi:FkbM family methyltransferase